VYNDIAVQTASQTITDIKFWAGNTGSSGNYEFDNFTITTLQPTLSLTQTAATLRWQ
jgi:hypothetical protein